MGILRFKVRNTLEKKGSTIKQLLKLIIGNIDAERDLYQFRKQILTFIDKQKIDLVIGNNVPGNILELMYFINKKSGLPYISDLRDFDTFLLLKKNPSFTIKQKTYFFFKYY